jgi:membrane dipeptidase
MTEDRQHKDRARRLLQSAVVWDNHGCMPLRADETFLPQLRRYREAGVTIVALNIGFADIPWTDNIQLLSHMRGWLTKHADEYRLVATVEDVLACKADGRLGVIFDVEGMSPVIDRPELVQTYYELGVRWMLITYNRNNAAGGGCMDNDTGLTDAGRRIIDEMGRVGMVLCLSHTGPSTVMQALEYSRHPVIYSHSNPFGDTPHVRNISDDLIRACARKGGVIGLSGFGPFLGASDDPVSALLRQLRYTIDLVGPEHVGLGLDYVFDRAELDEYVSTNPGLFPAGLTAGRRVAMVEPECMESIAEGLARDKLTDEQISGVLGGNWLRVARQVWKDPRHVS